MRRGAEIIPVRSAWAAGVVGPYDGCGGIRRGAEVKSVRSARADDIRPYGVQPGVQ